MTLDDAGQLCSVSPLRPRTANLLWLVTVQYAQLGISSRWIRGLIGLAGEHACRVGR